MRNIMKSNNPRRILAITAMVALTVLAGATGSMASQQAQPGRITLVDLMPLHAGADMQEVQAYLAAVGPILARHDIRFQNAYIVQRTLNGQAQPHFVFVYTVPSLATIQAVDSDPEYAPHIPQRNRLFDFSRLISLEVSPMPFGDRNAKGE